MTKGKGAPEKINIKFCAHSSRRAVFKAKFLSFPASNPPWHTVRSKRSKSEAQQNTYALAPPEPRRCVFCFFRPLRGALAVTKGKRREWRAKQKRLPIPSHHAMQRSWEGKYVGRNGRKDAQKRPASSTCRLRVSCRFAARARTPAIDLVNRDGKGNDTARAPWGNGHGTHPHAER